jgi:GNAT superfamily N-acetyltransferase
MVGATQSILEPSIRPVADGDSEALIKLIASVFAEYPGCVLDVDREEPMLRRPAGWAAEKSGQWWVLDYGGLVIGSVAVLPTARADTAELKKLYVFSSHRRRGRGRQLVELAEMLARQCGCTWMILWSDTRFADAHRLYERLGYKRGEETRALNDLSNTLEYRFVKALDPVTVQRLGEQR